MANSFVQQMVPADDEDEISQPTRPLTDPSTGAPALDANTTAQRKQMLSEYLDRVRKQRAQAETEAAQNQVGATDFDQQAATASLRNAGGAIANALNFTGALDPSKHVQSAVPQYMKEQNQTDLAALQGKQARYETALKQGQQANEDLVKGSDEAGKIQASDNAQTEFGNQQTKFKEGQDLYAQQTDSNSPISQTARKLAKDRGATVTDNDTFQSISENNPAIKDLFDRNTQLKVAATKTNATGANSARAWALIPDQATGQVQIVNKITGEVKQAPGGSIPVSNPETGEAYLDKNGNPWVSNKVVEHYLDGLVKDAQHDPLTKGALASLPLLSNAESALKLAATPGPDGKVNQIAFPEAVEALGKAMQNGQQLSDFKVKFLAENESLWRRMQNMAARITTGGTSAPQAADMQQLISDMEASKRGIVDRQINGVWVPKAQIRGVPGEYAAQRLRQIAPNTTESQTAPVKPASAPTTQPPAPGAIQISPKHWSEF